MYAPITWQVDRTCHKISASSFDEMCRYMYNQVLASLLLPLTAARPHSDFPRHCRPSLLRRRDVLLHACVHSRVLASTPPLTQAPPKPPSSSPTLTAATTDITTDITTHIHRRHHHRHHHRNYHRVHPYPLTAATTDITTDIT